MRNRYLGFCVHCGKPVAAGQGHFQRSTKEGNKAIGVTGWHGPWLIRCLDCVEKIRKEKAERETE